MFNSHVVCGYPEWLKNRPLLEVVSDNFTYDELVKPRLIEQPALEIMALKNENVSLMCKATSTSPDVMTFQWKKDNKDITNSNISVTVNNTNDKSIESTSILNIFMAQQNHAGKYQCVVSNRFGTTYSNKSNISVLSKLHFHICFWLK